MSKTILITAPETKDMYIVVDLNGNMSYKDNAMERRGDTQRTPSMKAAAWSRVVRQGIR